MSTPQFDPNSPYAKLRFHDVGGYMRATVRDHPVADARGRVRLHRAVLWDAIGAGPHECQWCGWPGLRWDVERPDPLYLTVDHVNGDGYDNRRSNLKCACSWCNNNRPIVEQLGISWSVFAGIPPGDRPALRVTHGGAPTRLGFIEPGQDELDRDLPFLPAAQSAQRIDPGSSAQRGTKLGGV